MSVLTDLIYGGSNAVAGLTEGAVNDAIAKYGADKELAFPDTAYYFPTIYAATGVKVKTLGKARFDFIQSRANAGKLILGEDTYGSKGEHYFWPKQYSSAKTAQKRIDKLTEAGMRCRMTGYNGGCIEFLGYTPETEARLEQERQEYIVAHRQWKAKQQPLAV